MIPLIEPDRWMNQDIVTVVAIVALIFLVPWLIDFLIVRRR